MSKRRMTVTISGWPGVGKTNLLVTGILPWCERNGFCAIQMENITENAAKQIEKQYESTCRIYEKRQ